jgi:hypothetical protein
LTSFRELSPARRRAASANADQSLSASPCPMASTRLSRTTLANGKGTPSASPAARISRISLRPSRFELALRDQPAVGCVRGRRQQQGRSVCRRPLRQAGHDRGGNVGDTGVDVRLLQLAGQRDRQGAHNDMDQLFVCSAPPRGNGLLAVKVPHHRSRPEPRTQTGITKFDSTPGSMS